MHIRMMKHCPSFALHKVPWVDWNPNQNLASFQHFHNVSWVLRRGSNRFWWYTISAPTTMSFLDSDLNSIISIDYGSSESPHVSPCTATFMNGFSSTFFSKRCIALDRSVKMACRDSLSFPAQQFLLQHPNPVPHFFGSYVVCYTARSREEVPSHHPMQLWIPHQSSWLPYCLNCNTIRW